MTRAAARLVDTRSDAPSHADSPATPKAAGTQRTTAIDFHTTFDDAPPVVAATERLSAGTAGAGANLVRCGGPGRRRTEPTSRPTSFANWWAGRSRWSSGAALVFQESRSFVR